MIQSATLLHIVQAGYQIFPLCPGAKNPITRRGVKDASSDPRQIEAWWRKNPQANVGLSCAGLIAIDLDPVDGAPNQWPQDPHQRADLGRAFIQRTPRAGTHHLFRLPPGKVFKNSKGKLAPGVDVRTNGGYIVLAPSILAPTPEHPGGQYIAMQPLPPRESLPELPGWLLEALEACEVTRVAPSVIEAPRSSVPAERKVERARAWLAKAEPAVSKQGGHNTTYRVVAALFEKFDLSQDQAIEALQEWNARCQPPWSPGDLRHKVQSADQHCKGPRGTLLGEEEEIDTGRLAGLDEIIAAYQATTVHVVQQPGFATPPPREPRLIATPLPDLQKRCGALEWVWQDWIGRGLLHLVTGDSGAGKTTVLFDLLATVYGGAPMPDGSLVPEKWRKRPLLYIDADLRASHQLAELAGRYPGDQPEVDVLEMQTEFDPIPRTVATWEDQPKLFGQLAGLLQSKPYWCLVIDTVSRFAGSSRLEVVNELSKWVSPLQRIARDLGIPIFLVGHANAGGGALGRHLVGACQLGWHIDGDGNLTQARSYGAPAEPLKFDFNDAGPLVWAKPAQSRESGSGSKPGASNGLREFILSHLSVLADTDPDLWLDQETWSGIRAQAIEAGLITRSDADKQKLNRALDSLCKSKAIEKKESVDLKNRQYGKVVRYALIGVFSD